MGVVIDTSVWSVAFRRKNPEKGSAAAALTRILSTQTVALPGVARMELLSGVASAEFLAALRKELRKYADMPMGVPDYELAADFRTLCRSKGLQGSLADFLVCAAAVRRDFAVFTIDSDFKRFAKFIPIQLHMPELISA